MSGSHVGPGECVRVTHGARGMCSVSPKRLGECRTGLGGMCQRDTWHQGTEDGRSKGQASSNQEFPFASEPLVLPQCSFHKYLNPSLSLKYDWPLVSGWVVRQKVGREGGFCAISKPQDNLCPWSPSPHLHLAPGGKKETSPCFLTIVPFPGRRWCGIGGSENPLSQRN